jgi:hypothetical protein
MCAAPDRAPRTYPVPPDVKVGYVDPETPQARVVNVNEAPLCFGTGPGIPVDRTIQLIF